MISKTYVDQILKRLPEIEHELSQAGTAGSRKNFKELSREHLRLLRIREKADALYALQKEIENTKLLATGETGDKELAAIAKEELAQLEKKLTEVENEVLLALIPQDPADERNVIMEIRAGTGGEEAALFAADLYRMYQKFSSEKGWKISMIDVSDSDKGGIKEIVFSVKGDGVYKILRYESGVHRVQRVPITEASGRIHTSAATVAVLPEADIEDDIEIKPEEIRVDIFCASGPGGQGVNTTYSAVRITHLPTGIVAQSQDERSQHRNKEIAMSVLKARLLDKKRREEEAKLGNMRRSQIGTGDRSERIRTYNFPQNRLTDHRINLTIYGLDQIMEGKIDDLLSSLRKHDIEMRLQKLSSEDIK